MKIRVTEKRVSITEYTPVNYGEYCVNMCEFELPESFEGLTVTAVFDGVQIPVINNMCLIPMLEKGKRSIGVYAYRKENDRLMLTYSPTPAYVYVGEGSYTEESRIQEKPDISEYERYCHLLASFCSEYMEMRLSEFMSGLVTVVNEDSTHSEYPSAKAVYDFVKALWDEIAEGIDEISKLVGGED